MAGRPNENKEGGLELIFLALAVPFIICALAWLMASDRIVLYFTPKLYFLGKLWQYAPGGMDKIGMLADGGRIFMGDPKKVDLGDFITYINISLMPLSVVAAAMMIVTTLPVSLLSGRTKLFRRYTPTELMREMSAVFTGNIPILHLRMKLAKDELPSWRRQTAPHEYLMSEKTTSGRPMLVDGVLDQDALAERLAGLVPGKLIEGRMVSTTLGRQIVNIADDRGRLHEICFPDRMSDIGKVIYALFAAHAFGGAEGVKDYQKAVDQLNRSCTGHPNGMANLTVAQWLYTKYRTNAKAQLLFSVHHWEYTYLSELIRQAKRQGKCGHTSVMWLKPMNRVLFYALNQVGRWVPHAESSPVFAQLAAERVASQNGMVMIKYVEELKRWMHTTYLQCALEGFATEWTRYVNGTDEDDDWWADSRRWTLLNGMQLESPATPHGAAADEVLKSSNFDRDQGGARSAADIATRKAESEAAFEEFIGKN